MHRIPVIVYSIAIVLFTQVNALPTTASLHIYEDSGLRDRSLPMPAARMIKVDTNLGSKTGRFAHFLHCLSVSDARYQALETVSSRLALTL